MFDYHTTYNSITILKNYQTKSSKILNKESQKSCYPKRCPQSVGVSQQHIEEKVNNAMRLPSAALLFLALWYLFSGLTLFLNKHIVDAKGGDPYLLGTTQMTMTLLLGLLQMKFPLGFYNKPKSKLIKKQQFYKQMLIVGGLRFLTVLFGLLALNYVPVSFTETVKSSAPIFTVLIAYIFSREKTGKLTLISLLPVMFGLVICSASEVQIEIFGLISALGANFTECLQNVYSKILLTTSSRSYTPAELQFYTSFFSIAVQLPIAWVFMEEINYDLMGLYALNGAFFHFQTISAYCLMEFLSPVGHSVANTLKRAILIILSIIIFGNQVSFTNWLGLVILFIGVFFYNEAKKLEEIREDSLEKDNSLI